LKNQTTTTAPAPASGRADAPSRAHAINTVTLELNAATAVRPFDDGTWATVFAIHNRYRGKDKPGKAVPISVKFGGNTASYAITAIRKGTHFTVSGSLDYDEGEQGKAFYRINADQLRVHTRKGPPTADRAES
jgi:hypothetical protein